jgi:hypothetical protein
MIPYTYTITEVNDRAMTIVYNSPGRDPVTMGARRPYAGETIDVIAQMYSPVALWLEQDATFESVTLGANGEFTLPTVPTVTLESAKTAKLEELAAWRFAKETSGVTVSGARIKTDRESQAIVTSALISLSQGLATSVDWKAEGGVWVTLGLNEITAIAQAVVAHVQACFTLEKQFSLDIAAAATVQDAEAITFPPLFNV